MREAIFDDSGIAEIVADDVVRFHLERMDEEAFSLVIEHSDGKITTSTIVSRRNVFDRPIYAVINDCPSDMRV